MTEKPARRAWTRPEQLVDLFMLPGWGRGDFYILCPPNNTTGAARTLDERRHSFFLWADGRHRRRTPRFPPPLLPPSPPPSLASGNYKRSFGQIRQT